MEETWFKRNAKGEQAEQEGRPDDAIELYEANVAEQATTLFSYERLAVLYQRRAQYKDEERALLGAINLLRQRERKGKLDSHQAKQLEELRRRYKVVRQNIRRRPKKAASGKPEQRESDPWITALLIALIAAALAVGAVLLL